VATIGEIQKPPDRKRRTVSKTEPVIVMASDKHAKRIEGVQGIWQLMQLPLIMTGNLADAAAITEHSPKITPEVVNVCEDNEKLTDKLDKAIALGPYAALVGVVIPFAMQIMTNHGIMRPEMGAGYGVVSPEALAAKQKAAMLRQASEALAMQRDAEEEMNRLSGEWVVPDDAAS
jgi:hypothetical protein